MSWLVKIRQNLTACDTIHKRGSTQRTLSEHVFSTEEEALKFYEGRKTQVYFAGLAGQYVTFPVEVEDQYKTPDCFCDECGEGFSISENDPGFSDLPNGNFCSRGCFRNSYQERSEYDEPYFEDEY